MILKAASRIVANASTKTSSNVSPSSRRFLNSSVLAANFLSDNLLYSSSNASICVAIVLNLYNSLYSVSNNFLNILIIVNQLLICILSKKYSKY